MNIGNTSSTAKIGNQVVEDLKHTAEPDNVCRVTAKNDDLDKRHPT